MEGLRQYSLLHALMESQVLQIGLLQGFDWRM